MVKDKKFLLLTSILFVVSLLLFATPAGAYIFQKVSSYASKYTMVANLENEENVVSVLQVATSTSDAYVILVDHSNRTMFPQYLSSSELRVSSIEVDWYTRPDRTGDTTPVDTTIRFGVIASTTPSGSVQDIAWFDTVSFSNRNANLPSAATTTPNSQHVKLNYSPSLLKLGRYTTSSATTTGFTTNLWTKGETALATSTKTKICPLVNDAGTQQFCFPGRGDLVAQFKDMTNISTTTIKTFYHTK